MGFYYFSLFSIVPLGIVYAFLALVFWGIVHATRGQRWRKTTLTIAGVVLLLLPVSEELWIAWNFGQACKDAGTLVHRRVEVDGFYDSTMRSAYENTKRGGYKFVEQATDDHKAIERVERADEASRSKALAWYTQQNPGKALSQDKSIVYRESDIERIVVFPNGVDAWRVTRLDRPAARYHYTSANHVPEAHKVVKHEYLIIDSTTKEALARELTYGRYAPWFFIGLDAPTKTCVGTRNVRGSLYENVLLPAGK